MMPSAASASFAGAPSAPTFCCSDAMPPACDTLMQTFFHQSTATAQGYQETSAKLASGVAAAQQEPELSAVEASRRTLTVPSGLSSSIWVAYSRVVQHLEECLEELGATEASKAQRNCEIAPGIGSFGKRSSSVTTCH